MVHHLHDTAGDRLVGESERTEHDEPEVRDARIRDESLEVLLHRRRNRAVDDADHRERVERRSRPHAGFREEIDTEAQQAVGAHLQEHAGKDDRAGGRRLRVRVGQPSVHGEKRHFHCERDCERDEEPAALRDTKCITFGECDEIEGDAAGRFTREQRGGDDADEHERRTRHREEEELRRRVHALVVAPSADEEVHRHEHDLEEDEEEEEIEAHERAHHAGLEHEQPGEIRPLVVVRVDTGDHEREEHAGQHHEKERDAVDAEVPRDSPVGNPLVARDELEAGVARFERLQHPQAERSGGDARDERRQLRPFRSRPTEREHGDRTDDRHDDERGEYRECERRLRRSEHHASHPLHTNQASSAMAPKAINAA